MRKAQFCYGWDWGPRLPTVHDVFYDLCDSLGLLVWQDFMFACATYPEEPPEFVTEVEAEARYQVRRLRSHPCVALLCGNNENQWIHDQVHWDDPHDRVPDEVLPRIVAELDGRTPTGRAVPLEATTTPRWRAATATTGRSGTVVLPGTLVRNRGVRPPRKPFPTFVTPRTWEGS